MKRTSQESQDVLKLLISTERLEAEEEEEEKKENQKHRRRRPCGKLLQGAGC